MGIQLGDGNWAVKEDKLLAYKKVGDMFFNKEFDFTRGSSGTYVGRDGLIKTAGVTPNNIVQNGNFSQEGPELVTNGGFDTDSYWVKGNGWSIANGKATATNASNSQAIRTPSLSITNYKVYKVQFTVSDYSSGAIHAYLGSNGQSDSFLGSFNSNGTYTVYHKLTNSISNYLLFRNGTSGSNYSIDNVSVKEVGQNWVGGIDGIFTVNENKQGVLYRTDTGRSRFGQALSTVQGRFYRVKFDVISATSGSGDIALKAVTTGSSSITGEHGSVIATINNTSAGSYKFDWVATKNNNYFGFIQDYNSSTNTEVIIDNISVQEIQVDTPRIDFSDSPKGALLLEPSSTNLLAYSENFSTWQTARSTFSTESGQSIVSGNNINKLTDSTDNGTHIIYRTAGSLNTSLEYTCSAFLKKGSLDYGFLAHQDSDLHTCVFNLNTGSIHIQGGSIIDAKIKLINNNWYKCSITFTPSSSTLMRIGTHNGTSRSYIGSGNDYIYFDAAQLEQKSFATSYIPTTTTTATRLEDFCVNSGSKQDFNQTEGVLFIETKSIGDSNSWREVAIGRGGYGQRVVFSFTSANVARAHVDSGGTQFSYSDNGGDIDIKKMHKYAIKYKPNDFSFFVDGIKIAQDNSGSTFNSNAPLQKLAFNSIASAYGSSFHSKTKNLKVFKRALSDTELYLLTTPVQYQSYEAMAATLNYTI